MPQVSAADLRSAPSSTIARASIRRAAEPSFSRPADARSSAAVKSTRVIATAPPIDVCSSLMSKHRVRVSSNWKSQNESKAATVGIMGHGKAEPRSFPCRLRGEKGNEDLFLYFRWNASAVVANADFDCGADVPGRRAEDRLKAFIAR